MNVLSKTAALLILMVGTSACGPLEVRVKTKDVTNDEDMTSEDDFSEERSTKKKKAPKKKQDTDADSEQTMVIVHPTEIIDEPYVEEEPTTGDLIVALAPEVDDAESRYLLIDYRRSSFCSNGVGEGWYVDANSVASQYNAEGHLIASMPFEHIHSHWFEASCEDSHDGVTSVEYVADAHRLISDLEEGQYELGFSLYSASGELLGESRGKVYVKAGKSVEIEVNVAIETGDF